MQTKTPAASDRLFALREPSFAWALAPIKLNLPKKRVFLCLGFWVCRLCRAFSMWGLPICSLEMRVAVRFGFGGQEISQGAHLGAHLHF